MVEEIESMLAAIYFCKTWFCKTSLTCRDLKSCTLKQGETMIFKVTIGSLQEIQWTSMKTVLEAKSVF